MRPVFYPPALIYFSNVFLKNIFDIKSNKILNIRYSIIYFFSKRLSTGIFAKRLTGIMIKIYFQFIFSYFFFWFFFIFFLIQKNLVLSHHPYYS
ncbi:hypothetical protein X275_04120 [Marinitoga sp. 1197]|nr:hypothetical protein X275_04120 [Marinitoga sp. 1197]